MGDVGSLRVLHTVSGRCSETCGNRRTLRQTAQTLRQTRPDTRKSTGQMPRPSVPRNSTAAHRACGFARTKFRPTTLPSTLVTRSLLHDQLTSGAGKRLTVVVGSAGSGKSVLLSNWAATRSSGTTSWLSCDKADADPVRFWSGFIEALQAGAPGFGADAADVLALDSAMSADVTASLANDALKLPGGMAIIVDDFQAAATGASAHMTDLVERWPGEIAQLVLASRNDPPVRLHRLRLAGELCELRDDDLSLSLPETGDLLANFGVEMAAADLALLHERSEGWAAAVQMAALSLRAADDPARIARALDVRSHLISGYFIAEVLDQQPPELARFLLDTSVLGELTVGSCAAVSGQQDAAALLRHIDAANLFLVPLDDERTIFRYHHLVRQVLRAELRARDSAREHALQLRAGEWCEAAGDTRRATRHFLAAQQADRALTLLQDRVVPDFLRDPIAPSPLDMNMVDPVLLADAPERTLGLAADLLLSGDIERGGAWLDAIERAEPPIPPGSRLAARFALMRAFQYGQAGRLTEAVAAAHTARGIQEVQLSDEWHVAIPLILLRVYPCLDDFPAVEREAEAALALPGLPEPARLILVPSAQALGRFLAGHLTEAARAARAAEWEARRLGFDRHFFAVDYLRVLAGLALERRDLSTAERLAERSIAIAEAGRPIFEFLTLLDRARIWAARGKIRDALTTVAAARRVLAEPSAALRAQADELEAHVRLALGDVRAAAELAGGVPAARRDLLLARIALAAGNHQAAQDHLQLPTLGSLTPRNRLVRQILLAAAAIERGDPTADGIVGGVVQRARQEGFIDTLVSTAPQVTGYLVEHAARMRSDPYLEQVITAALDVRASLPDRAEYRQLIAEPLTAAELRILKLLPTSTYLQIAATLYISRNTVKTQLRSVYQKLGVTSRSEAVERAVDLRLL
jgi:LuxR family maltose regulon positive regulatory protein